MATTDRWKYLVMTLKGSFLNGLVANDQLQNELDQKGLQGWELIRMSRTGSGCQLVFKRPM